MKRHPFDKPYCRVSFVAILIIGSCLNVSGQAWTQYDQGTPPQHAAGVSPVGSYVSSDLGTVNLGNGALNLSLPLGTVGGRGFSIPLSLSYSSKVWSVAHDEGYDSNRDMYFNMAYAEYGAEESFIDIYNRIAVGWTINGVPMLKLTGVALQPCSNGWPLYSVTKLTVVLPDKGEIELRDDQTDGAPINTNCTSALPYRGQRWHATDGSGIVFISDADNGVIIGDAAGTLITADGMRYRFQNGNSGAAFGRCNTITDRNGNRIEINHSVDPNNNLHITTEYKDQLGRTTKVEQNAADPANPSVILPVLVTLKGYQGTPQYYKVKTGLLKDHIRSDLSYNGQPILTGFNDRWGNCWEPQPPGANYVFSTSYCEYQERIDNKSQVNQVILPDGRSLQFNYNLYGELAEVVLPTGAKTQYDYSLFTTGFPAGNTLPMEYQGQGNSVHIDRAITERRTYPDGSTVEGTFTYGFGPQEVNGVSHHCTETKAYEGTTSGTLLSRQRHFFLQPGRYLSGAAGNVSGTGYSLWSTGVEWRTEVLDGAGTVLSATEQDWLQRASVVWTTGYTQQQPANDNRVSQTRRYIEGGSFGKTETFYDNVNYPRANNVSEVKEYDFDQSLKRRSTTIYVTGSYQSDYAIHLLRLVQQQSVYDGSGTNEVARTVNQYDVYGDGNHLPLQDYGTVIAHDNAYGTTKLTRGNLTGSGRWLKTNDTTIYSYLSYDTLGNPIANKDAKGKTTTLSYLDDFGDGSNPGAMASGVYGATYAFPTLITSPPPTAGAAVHTARTQYDFWSGQLAGFKDRNGVITQTIYNDPFSRATLVKSALGSSVESHAAMYYAPATAFGITLTNNDVLAAKDQSALNDANLRSWTHTDGFGRTVQTWSRDPQGDLRVSSDYDALGRVRLQSNPFRPSLGENAIYTTTNYDLAGRVTSVTTPDNATVHSSYWGNQVMVSDQTSKKRISKTNALGQLTDVWEITGADGATESVTFNQLALNGYRTKYAYDTLSNLTNVTQQVGTSGPTLARIFVYNSLSQLTDATNPESGHIVYDYDANGNLWHKTDARQITSTYVYDALNRNTSIDYSNTANLNPDIKRVYDGAANGIGRFSESYAGGTETAGDIVENQKVLSYDKLGRPLIQQQRFKSGTWSPHVYQTVRIYNLSGGVTSQTYPSGRTVAYEYDTAGRTSSFIGNLGGAQRSYATEIIYSPLGGMTKEKFGTDTAIYNKLFYNSRGQLAEIRAGESYTGPNDTGWERGAIINYYSTCWGMCGGHNSTTQMTDNNGNLKKQEVFIPGSNSWLQEYDYDNLNRLVSVQETTGDSNHNWRQEYDYDRYGNRTIDQVNTSGPSVGPLIPKPNFEVETATNRLLAPGDLALPLNQRLMQYDAAGNLEKDNHTGAGERIYDAENRMTRARGNNNQWQEYGYNADGQRVRRKVDGVETWQVYGFDGELLAEYAAGDAAASPQKEHGYRNGQLLIIAEPPTGLPPPLNVQNVTWTNVSSTVQVTGNSIQKMSGAYAWDAGAVSTQTIASGNGYVDFVPGETGTYRMCGLGNGDSSASYSDIEYAFFIYGGGGLSIYESGVDRGSFGSYAASDHLKIAVENGAVKYYRNGTLLYTSTVAPTYPLQVDTSLNTVYAGVYNVVLANNVQNVTWTNVSSTVQVTGNSIQKMSGAYAWDAGAVSTQTIASGNGYVDFVPGETGTYRMCGLGNGDSSASYSDIEYAFFIYGGGGLSIYESGVDRGSFGSYAATDHLKIAVENGAVKYYRNSTLLYTSTVAPTYPLQVDTSLHTVYAGVYNVVITSNTPSTSGNIQWLVTDQLGTPRMIFDQTGSLASTKRHDYLPFGEELVAGQGLRTTGKGYVADTVRQKFTSYERDSETGLDYAINRFYSQTQGRFTSFDPLQESGEVQVPQSWNRYSYAINNPLKFIDPDGLRYVQRQLAGGRTEYGWCSTDECYNNAIDTNAKDYAGWTAVTFDESKPFEFRTVGGGGGERYSSYRLNPDGTHGHADLLDGYSRATSTDWNTQLAIGGLLNGLRSLFSGIFSSLTTGTATQQATTHGAKQLAGRGFTEADIVLTKSGQQFLQRDGATVFLKEVAPGKFNVLVEGQRGTITALKNVSEKKIAKLAANYGWYSPLK